MNPRTVRREVDGPAGTLEIAVDEPEGKVHGLALLCHPHPLHGGTLDNKIVQTLARSFVQLGWRAVRFNFRGAGNSTGHWAEGVGEIEDAMHVLSVHRQGAEAVAIGGFSFGAYVASHVAHRLRPAVEARHLVLVGPAVTSFQLAPVPADTLVLHGERDEVVPLSAVLDWARPSSLPVTVFPGSGHFFHGQLASLKHWVLRNCAAI
jgi:alpha/beta superfamily hydrolase